MLRCWDADPEDRPSFTKIAQTISKSLQIMSEYLDLSMVQAVNAQEDGNNELKEVTQTCLLTWGALLIITGYITSCL